ncbi:MAG: LysM peptidoglycan-binding domain-containing protein [Steroidobacteraceae bacterium]
MKTISSPMQYWRGLCVSSTLACAMLAGGLALSTTSQAQNSSSERMLATGTHLPLAANAPDSYTVKAGDTLWDISKTFLSQPWYWPELWYLNPQIQNPHLIYPGDVLSLVTVDGQPRLMVTERGGEQAVTRGNGVRLSPQVHSEPLEAVTAIPYKVIAAFLGRPSVVSKDEVKSAPHLIHVRDKHIVGSAGDEVYARGIGNAGEGFRYNIIHVGEPLRDPENNDLLGYRGVYVGTGPVVTAGDPAKLKLNETAREVLPGDKLFAETYQMNMDFVPHAPAGAVEGSIFAVNGVFLAGRYQVVAINRGSKSGLETGHVLAIYQAGETINDRYSDGRSADPMHTPSGLLKKKVKLPDERAGTVMVFKTYERMSYALIMDADHPISIGDRVRNP